MPVDGCVRRYGGVGVARRPHDAGMWAVEPIGVLATDHHRFTGTGGGGGRTLIRMETSFAKEGL